MALPGAARPMTACPRSPSLSPAPSGMARASLASGIGSFGDLEATSAPNSSSTGRAWSAPSPEVDGGWMMEVHIFPENQRGATEGFRPWDQRPNSTMTNATVAQTVKGTDGQNILVKYKDGEKKVVVPPGTPIVTFVAGDKSELKAGAKVIIFGAVKKDDGTLEANRVNVGRDGITPPM